MNDKARSPVGRDIETASQGTITPSRRAAVEAALVESHRRIFGYLVSRLRNTDDAMDVMQGFSVQAIRRSDDLRDVESVRGWLSRLLATAIADHYRRSARRKNREKLAVPVDDAAELAPGPDPDADMIICACLRDIIGLLPPVAAALVRRIDLEEEPRPVVAASLGITEGALAVRLHRARAKLRDLLVAMCLTCPVHGFLDCACDRARILRQSEDQLRLAPAV